VQQVSFSMSWWQGAVPPPDITDAYEQRIPGAGRELFDQARRQTDHRMALETKVTDANLAHQRVTIICGTIILLGAMATAVALALVGQPATAFIVAMATLVSAVGGYLFVTNRQAAERAEKRKTIAERTNQQRQIGRR